MATNQPIKLDPKFITAPEAAKLLGISEASAYRIIKKLNDELKAQNKITIRGKVSYRYFIEKIAL